MKFFKKMVQQAINERTIILTIWILFLSHKLIVDFTHLVLLFLCFVEVPQCSFVNYVRSLSTFILFGFNLQKNFHRNEKSKLPICFLKETFTEPKNFSTKCAADMMVFVFNPITYLQLITGTGHHLKSGNSKEFIRDLFTENNLIRTTDNNQRV